MGHNNQKNHMNELPLNTGEGEGSKSHPQDKGMNQEVHLEGESIESTLLHIQRRISVKFGCGAKGFTSSITQEGVRSVWNTVST
jgi:hypothetical protein